MFTKSKEVWTYAPLDIRPGLSSRIGVPEADRAGPAAKSSESEEAGTLPGRGAVRLSLLGTGFMGT